MSCEISLKLYRKTITPYCAISNECERFSLRMCARTCVLDDTPTCMNNQLKFKKSVRPWQTS